MSRHMIDRPGIDSRHLAAQLGAHTMEPVQHTDGDDLAVSYVRFLDTAGAEVDLDDATVQQAVEDYTPPPEPDPVADLMAALGPADTVAKIKAALTTHLPRALGRSR